MQIESSNNKIDFLKKFLFKISISFLNGLINNDK